METAEETPEKRHGKLRQVTGDYAGLLHLLPAKIMLVEGTRNLLYFAPQFGCPFDGGHPFQPSLPDALLIDLQGVARVA